MDTVYNPDSEEADLHDIDLVADRRLTLQFFAVWDELAAGRGMPALQDFTPAILAPFKDQSVLIDLQEGAGQAAIRHVGALITAHMEQNGAAATDMAGVPLAAIAAASLLGRITVHAPAVIDSEAPVAFEATYDHNGQSLPYRALLAPLSRDGDRIDFLLGVLSWRDPPRGRDLDHSLAGLRKAAQTAGRSRTALYDLLARIRDFSTAGQEQPERLDALFREAGIRVQKRARETAVLKLVFGKGYDKTRLTEYAAALALAARCGLDGPGFLARLTDADGGLKAMVRAERAARHPAKASTKTENPKTVIRAVIDDWRTPAQKKSGTAGTRLRLAARTTADGRIEILDIAPEKD